MTIMSSSSRAQDHQLANTYCSRGHIHPPWNTKGILRIAKCESVCGFCQKETKTAANLRKHVAIHIKNEGLNLTIAEGSSGRGRLEMPASELERRSSTTFSRSPPHTSSSTFSAPSSLLSMSHPTTSSRASTPTPSPPTQTQQLPFPQILDSIYSALPHPQTFASTPAVYSHSQSPPINAHPQDPSPLSIYPPHLPLPPAIRSYRQANDPFYTLRSHNLSTKIAWTAIPASEGQRILDICKRDSDSVSSSSDFYSSSSSVARDDGGRQSGRIPEAGIHLPCYNRKLLYDDEWQAHMRDVHGVFLLWPDTWMKRVEVLDLDAFGGDIGACNGVIMEG